MDLFRDARIIFCWMFWALSAQPAPIRTIVMEQLKDIAWTELSLVFRIAFARFLNWRKQALVSPVQQGLFAMDLRRNVVLQGSIFTIWIVFVKLVITSRVLPVRSCVERWLTSALHRIVLKRDVNVKPPITLNLMGWILFAWRRQRAPAPRPWYVLQPWSPTVALREVIFLVTYVTFVLLATLVMEL